MSCFKKIAKSSVLLVVLVMLAGCTARPLYSDGRIRTSSNEGATAVTAVPFSIEIDEAKDRNTQILRNRLIFLMADSGTQSEKSYQLSLVAKTQTIATVQIDVGDRTDRTGRPSAGTVRAQADYVLRDRQGNMVAKGRRSMTAPFDRPRQEYANLRAEEDAKKRALEELAAQIFFALRQDLIGAIR